MVIGRHRPSLVLGRPRKPLHQSTLRAVGEALFHCDVRSQHATHHVRPAPEGLILDRMVPVSHQMQIPQTLRANLLAEHLHPTFRVPLATASASWSNFSFYFYGMVVLLGNSPTKRSVVLVPVASLCENTRVALEGTTFGRVVSTTHVAIDNEFPDGIAVLAHGDVRQDVVELFQLILATFIRDYTTICVQASEVEQLVDRRNHDEGCFTRCRR